MPTLHTANRHNLAKLRHARDANAAEGISAAASPKLAAAKARAAARAARTRHTPKA